MYPRIILDKSIIELNKNQRQISLFEDEMSKEKMILGYLSKDTDEKYYIDYFPKDIGEYKYITNIQTYLVNLRQIIINGSKSTKPDIKKPARGRFLQNNVRITSEPGPRQPTSWLLRR